MRLFVSIPVSNAVVKHVAVLRNELDQNHPDVKWVKKENYHLTLKFLGEVDPKMLNAIRERLRRVGEACPSFSLETRGIGYFPNQHRPRVIWAGIQGEMEKADFLAERIDTYLAELDFEPEKKRDFHLTLGRVRSDLSPGNIKMMAAVAARNNKIITFQVQAFHLMESKIYQHGPEYTILDRFSLTG